MIRRAFERRVDRGERVLDATGRTPEPDPVHLVHLRVIRVLADDGPPHLQTIMARLGLRGAE